MQPSRPDLRPLGIADIVAGAIRLYSTNFVTLVKIAAAVVVPVTVLDHLIVRSLLPDSIDISEVDLGAVLGVLLASLFINLVAMTLVNGGSITALAQVYLGRVPDWADSLRAGGRRWLPLLASSVIVAVASAFGLLLLVIPGVILAVHWSVTAPTVVTERLGAGQALGKSWGLVRGRFWPVLGTLLLGYLFSWLASAILGSLARALGLGPESLGAAAIATVGVIVTAPFHATLATVLYFDLRVRKEGYDLHRMALDLPADPEAAGSDDPFGLGRPGER